MNQYEMVILIVLIVVIGRVLRSRHVNSDPSLGERNGRGRRDRQGIMGEPGAVSAAEAERMRAEIARLNDRLAVLERIATDPAKRLSDEIDSLKHK